MSKNISDHSVEGIKIIYHNDIMMAAFRKHAEKEYYDDSLNGLLNLLHLLDLLKQINEAGSDKTKRTGLINKFKLATKEFLTIKDIAKTAKKNTMLPYSESIEDLNIGKVSSLHEALSKPFDIADMANVQSLLSDAAGKQEKMLDDDSFKRFLASSQHAAAQKQLKIKEEEHRKMREAVKLIGGALEKTIKQRQAVLSKLKEVGTKRSSLRDDASIEAQYSSTLTTTQTVIDEIIGYDELTILRVEALLPTVESDNQQKSFPDRISALHKGLEELVKKEQTQQAKLLAKVKDIFPTNFDKRLLPLKQCYDEARAINETNAAELNNDLATIKKLTF